MFCVLCNLVEKTHFTLEKRGGFFGPFLLKSVIFIIIVTLKGGEIKIDNK